MITTEHSETERVRVRAPWRRWIAPVALTLVPWSWFALRDTGNSMDAVALGLPLGTAIAAAVAFGLAMLSEHMRFALVSLSLAVFTVVVVLEPRLPQPSPAPLDPVRVVAANTFDHNPSPRRAVRALLAQHADVLVDVETRRSILDGLDEAYPSGRIQDLGDLSVFSRWPVRALPPAPGVASADAMRVEVLRPGSPFVLYAIHLANPLHEISFSQHAATVTRLLASVEREDLPVVLAGDFNMSDRSTSYRLLDGALRDAMRASFARSTYDQNLWVLLQLRIDHVFVSPELCASSPGTFGVPGSDHDGVAVTLGACPS